MKLVRSGDNYKIRGIINSYFQGYDIKVNGIGEIFNT
jgi:hypothetical protein